MAAAREARVPLRLNIVLTKTKAAFQTRAGDATQSGIAWRARSPAVVAGHGLLRPAGRVASGGDGHGQDALARRGRDDGVEAAVGAGHGLDDHGRVVRGTGLCRRWHVGPFSR